MWNQDYNRLHHDTARLLTFFLLGRTERRTGRGGGLWNVRVTKGWRNLRVTHTLLRNPFNVPQRLLGHQLHCWPQMTWRPWDGGGSGLALIYWNGLALRCHPEANGTWSKPAPSAVDRIQTHNQRLWAGLSQIRRAGGQTRRWQDVRTLRGDQLGATWPDHGSDECFGEERPK